MTFAARPLSREITMSQAYQNMCAGMYKVSDVLWIVIVKITFFKKNEIWVLFRIKARKLYLNTPK